MEKEYKNELSWSQQSFLTVCREHKATCGGKTPLGEDCNVSMFALGQIFKSLVGRELSEEEFNIFS